MSLKGNRQETDGQRAEEKERDGREGKGGRRTVNECQTAQAGRQSGRVGGL